MKVISGGQTGADRTGLEVARELGIETGGTVPKGCRTDEGSDRSLLEFGCVESPFGTYRPRTRQNAKDADGTVWFGNTDSPGYTCTAHGCRDYAKPLLVNPSVTQLVDWLRQHRITVLNVAGNRRRTNSAVIELTRSVLKPALQQVLQSAAQQDNTRPVAHTSAVDIRGMVHSDDPSTSIEAAIDIARRRTELHARILEAFRAHGPMTDEELEQLDEFQNFGPSTIRKRRSELYQQKALAAVDERKNSRGYKMLVWNLAEADRELPA